MKVYCLVRSNFEYNDEYYYPTEGYEIVNIFKDKDEATKALDQKLLDAFNNFNIFVDFELSLDLFDLKKVSKTLSPELATHLREMDYGDELGIELTDEQIIQLMKCCIIKFAEIIEQEVV